MAAWKTCYSVVNTKFFLTDRAFSASIYMRNISTQLKNSEALSREKLATCLVNFSTACRPTCRKHTMQIHKVCIVYCKNYNIPPPNSQKL